MKPMLAATVDDPTKLRFPLLASPKLDGIRCLITESPRTGHRIACSRTLKPIPNRHIRATLENSSLPLGMDGELIVGTNFQQTASAVMSFDGSPDFKYYVFDFVESTEYYAETRHIMLNQVLARNQLSWLIGVKQELVTNLKELDEYEQACLEAGHEGVMLKSPTTTYKFGRSTLAEQKLLKLKRFKDAEAKVIGFTELMHNENEQTLDCLGLAERSSHQDQLAPGNTLGALVCKMILTSAGVMPIQYGVEFKIGTGFTVAQRRDIWANREQWLNTVVTFKYQDFGIKVAPRAPVFLRQRLDYKL